MSRMIKSTDKRWGFEIEQCGKSGSSLPSL